MHPTAPSSSCAALVVIDRITWSPCAGQRGRLLRNAHASPNRLVSGSFGSSSSDYLPLFFQLRQSRPNGSEKGPEVTSSGARRLRPRDPPGYGWMPCADAPRSYFPSLLAVQL